MNIIIWNFISSFPGLFLHFKIPILEDPWSSLVRDSGLISKLQVQWEILSHKIRWEVVEAGTQCWLWASKCTTSMYPPPPHLWKRSNMSTPSWGTVTHIYNLSTQESKAGGSKSSRPVWVTEWTLASKNYKGNQNQPEFLIHPIPRTCH